MMGKGEVSEMGSRMRTDASFTDTGKARNLRFC